MTNTSSKAYDNMSQYERTVAVTPDYMIDLFKVASASERQFDWIMRGIGSFETDGEMEPMTEPLGTEDAYSFFRNGHSAQADGIWEGTWRTSAGNGLKLFSLTSSEQQPTTMIVGESPGPGNDTDAYTPTVVNRVNGTEARYVSVLEPFSGESKIQSVRRLNSKPIEQIEVKLTDGRTNLFQYEFGELEPGQLQYVFLEGAEMDTSDVSLLAYMDGATLNVTLNNGVEIDRGTFVIYAPGAEQVRWNGEAISFTSNNGYVMIHVETEEEPAVTPEPSPSESTGSTPPPASMPSPSATPAPTNAPKPSTTPGPTPKSSAKPAIKDIGEHWANKEIHEVIERGIAQGFGDGTFRPNQSVTREQFIVMVMNALRPNEEASAAPSFKDGADLSSWATRAIALADEMGLMSGYEDGTFRPKNELTRSQLAVLLARTLGTDAPNVNSASGYADEATIPAWARPAARLLKVLGIMNGRPGNIFAPLDKVTRAEAVTVILRLVRYLEEDE
ncbi:S-layer homology domain-containing protein [Paenibacillus sp. PAMC21692]|uniref:S-layer homology domain-containing protein n=1 Tax=Paenibacillus sp. PAMC21692 TaxID=2762320 RepID=UPI00164D7FFB|nr:S-layer homology domain-containing protein [Paenibacillus sp. PAMC21692]QNK55079.1 S-layer homology domain-containing protein [Paenibacillus sp. PAMC21692]